MRIFLSGLGTVGQGVLEVISAKMPLLEKNYGGVKVVGVMDSKSYAICDDGLDMGSVLSKKRSERRCGDADRNGMNSPEILGKVDYDLLIECTPTNIDDGGEGLKNITSALENGKDVITVNKGPLALEFCKLMELAKKNGSIMRFEGSVGGAMPIINLCKEGLAGQEIRSINGIFNGTCNFILSRMDRGMPFDQALKEAQQLGYAEADPTYDIKGIDSACKVAILANAVFKKDVTIRDVTINGIDTITDGAISLAKDHDMVIRLIGEVSKDKLDVSPRLIPKGHPLSITGTLNTAVIQTDFAGPITVSGRGAGKNETASAILGDLIFILEARKK